MPYLTPDAPSSSGGRVLVIPNTYLPAVNGALIELLAEWNWEEFGTETIADAIAEMETMIDDYLASDVVEFNGMSAPITPHIWNYNIISIAPLWTTMATMPSGGYYASGNNTINGYVGWFIAVSSGTWSITMSILKRNSSGIANIKVDGVSKGTIDFYAGGNTIAVVTLSLGVLTAGLKQIRLDFPTKNAASGNYGWNIAALSFEKTA